MSEDESRLSMWKTENQLNRCINLETGYYDQIRDSRYISRHVPNLDEQQYQTETTSLNTNEEYKIIYQIQIINQNTKL